MNSEATLTSLAMLKVNIDGGKDYLEYLRPFILDAIQNVTDQVITDEIIKGKLLSTFGLEIPRRTVQLLLRRIKETGVITKKDGYYEITGSVPETSLTTDKVAAERHISAVVDGLVSYFKETKSTHEFNEEIAMNALLTFLSSFSIPCLKAYLKGTTIPYEEGSGKNWVIILVSQFVHHIHKNNPERFDSFMKLVRGNMLANALLCPDLKYVTNSYNNVTFYLDTPLLLQLLGLEGDPSKQAVQELLKLVFNLKGKVSCFSHTRDELETVIRASADYINSANGKSKIILEARRNNITRSDFLLMAEKIDDYLAESQISVEKTPAYIEKFQINENTFTKFLDDEVPYHNPKAREYDINSVRSIYVLRSGTSPISIEKCKAVLVTSNTAFSTAAYDFGKNHNESREISSVITDFSLANTAWLKAPLGAPSLPQKEVLAFAYAGLNPNQRFWEKFLMESEKLERSKQITARDHQLLRSNPLSQSELMKLTLGEEEALTSYTITETLKRVTEEIKSEGNAKLSEINEEHNRTRMELEQIKKERNSTQQKIYWDIKNRSKCDADAIHNFFGFLIIVGVFRLNGLFELFGVRTDSLIYQSSVVIVTVITVISLFYGITTKKLHVDLENYIFKKRVSMKQKELDKLGIALNMLADS
ncbi:MAG: hypothetical protein PHC99_08600 [Methylococcales bacterium]|nr:hypothetical protein [Methylococcales bacterium]